MRQLLKTLIRDRTSWDELVRPCCEHSRLLVMLRVVALPSAVAGVTVWRLLYSESEEFYDADTVHAPLRERVAGKRQSRAWRMSVTRERGARAWRVPGRIGGRKRKGAERTFFDMVVSFC